VHEAAGHQRVKEGLELVDSTSLVSFVLLATLQSPHAIVPWRASEQSSDGLHGRRRKQPGSTTAN
jgi:hypothetical protein